MNTDSTMQGISAVNAMEAKPLEEIGRLVDDLERMNSGVLAYLNRFNGPQPTTLDGSRDPDAKPPSTYRYEIERLRRTVAETGGLVDQLTRLG